MELVSPLTPTQRVRGALCSQAGVYLTPATLCTLTGLRLHQVKSAIQILTRQGVIRRLVPPGSGIPIFGKQAYAWKDVRADHVTD